MNKSQSQKHGGRIYVKFSQEIIEKDSVGDGYFLLIYRMNFALKMSIDDIFIELVFPYYICSNIFGKNYFHIL